MDNGTFRIEDTTLDEMWELEKAAGRNMSDLLGTATGSMLAVAFLRRYRSSGQLPSWPELLSLRLQDVPSWISSSPPGSAGPPPRPAA
jgi:hypothetical protein